MKRKKQSRRQWTDAAVLERIPSDELKQAVRTLQDAINDPFRRPRQYYIRGALVKPRRS
jgi:hypothetical protein